MASGKVFSVTFDVPRFDYTNDVLLDPCAHVIPYMRAVKVRDMSIYDEFLLQVLPEDGDLEDPYFNPETGEVCNWDIHQSESYGAMEPLKFPLRVATYIPGVELLLRVGEDLSISTLGKESLVLTGTLPNK